MPSGIAGLDIGFPSFTGSESTEQKINTILNYQYMLLENLRYMLANLSSENFNSAALEKLKTELAESIETGTVISDVVISGTVITQNLFAEYGDITELTVDYLMSLNKVARWWAADTSEANFIRIHNQTIEILTGTTDGSTVQHRDRNGNLLYYKAAVTSETYKLVGMSTAPTAWPVMVYAYTELDKLIIGHVYDEESGFYLPQIIMGAGTGVGSNDKFIMTKREDRMSLLYVTDSGDEVPIELTDYVDAKMRRLESCEIDKTAGTVSVLMEGQTEAEVLTYTETSDSMSFEWPDGHVCTVTIG